MYICDFAKRVYEEKKITSASKIPQKALNSYLPNLELGGGGLL
jgi:hypothetical protein